MNLRTQCLANCSFAAVLLFPGPGGCSRDDSPPHALNVRIGQYRMPLDAKRVLLLEVSHDWSSHSGLITAEEQRDSLWGYMNIHGKVIIPFQFTLASEFECGRAVVSVHGHPGIETGLIDTKGHWKFGPKADILLSHGINEGLVACRIAAGASTPSQTDSPHRYKFGFLNRTGKFVISPQFDDVSGGFSEGLATVEKDGKWGYIDRTGRFVIPPKFESAKGFHEGLAPVKMNSRWGFINHGGVLVIQPVYIWAQEFRWGQAVVQVSASEVDVIDICGNPIAPEDVTDYED